MSIFLCKPDGDFAIVNNHMWLNDAPLEVKQTANGTLDSVTDNQQEVLQLIRNRLKFFKGEEPTNITLGVPYFEQIFDKQTPLSVSESILRDVVQTTPGVKEVIEFALVVDSQRRGTVTFTVNTIDGNITSTETL